MENQGGIANAQGRTLESVVISTLEQKGFRKVPYKEYLNGLNIYGDELLLTNVPCETIYGHKGKTEFKIQSQRYGEYRIECKWQQSSGSVDSLTSETICSFWSLSNLSLFLILTFTRLFLRFVWDLPWTRVLTFHLHLPGMASPGAMTRKIVADP